MSEYIVPANGMGEEGENAWLVDALFNEGRDPVIVSFDETVRNLSKSLHRQYVDGGYATVPESDLDDYEESLNDEWRRHDEAARVSGRCYILRVAETEVLEALVSDIATTDDNGTVIYYDENEEPYCFLTDARLQSKGLVVDPLYGDDEKLVTVRAGYAFLRYGDPEEELPLVMFPEDMTQHDYLELPRLRLEHQWPEELEVIDTILAPDGGIPLTARLTRLVNELQDVLFSDEAFRRVTERYINDMLELDQKTPYITMIHTELGVHSEDDDAEDWTPLTLHESLAIYLHEPEVRLALIGDDNVGAFIGGSSYNETDGNSAEMVVAATHYIDKFQSTRSRRSLVDIAMMNLEKEVTEGLENEPTEPTTVEFSHAEEAEDDTVEGDKLPEAVDKLVDTLTTLHDIQGQAERLRQRQFATREAALAAVNEFLKRTVPILGESLLFSGYIFEATGDQVYVADDRTDDRMQQLREEGIGGYASDAAGARSLMPGETARGSVTGIYPAIGEVEDDGSTYYVAEVALAVETQSMNTRLLYRSSFRDGAPLAEVGLRKQAAVVLGGSTDISSPIVDRYYEQRNAYERAKREYETLPLLERIEQLRDAMRAEDLNGFIDLSPADVFANISRDLGEAAQKQKSAKPLVNILETEFLHRKIFTVSDVYERVGDEYVSDEARAGASSGWYVFDVQSDASNEEVAFLVKAADTEDEVFRYIPLSSITHCRF